jgi:hypothetical protein
VRKIVANLFRPVEKRNGDGERERRPQGDEVDLDRDSVDSGLAGLALFPSEHRAGHPGYRGVVMISGERGASAGSRRTAQRYIG